MQVLLLIFFGNKELMLTVEEMLEMSNDYRYHERQTEYSTQSTKSSDYFADDRLGDDIAVADGCPCDDRPPEASRNTFKVRARAQLGIIYCRAKNNDADTDHHDHQTHFVTSGFHG